MILRHTIYVGCALLAGCGGSRARLTHRADAGAVAARDSDAGPTVIDVSSLDAKARDASVRRDRDAGIKPTSHPEQSPITNRDDHDGGVVPAPRRDGSTTAAGSGSHSEGQLCVFGPTVIGVELDGECAFPPIGSYSLTCGDQHCEQDWCETEYRYPDWRFMVMGSLYCSDSGCACRCRGGYGCVRDNVVYCDTRSC